MWVAGAQTPPTLSKVFSPTTIGSDTSAPPANSDNYSTLTFTVGNPNSSNLTGVAFADTLPDGLVVANPPTISGFSCTGSGVPAPTMTGTITANAGTNTISLNGGSITNVAPVLPVTFLG